MAKNWKCVDCSKLIWNRYQRCKSCASKGSGNRNYGKGLFKENNPNWRGGIDRSPYAHNYKKLRPYIHLRYLTCQICKSDQQLIVHHINHNRLDNSASNLISLCRSCNSKETWRQNYYQPYLGYKVYLKFLEVVG